MGGSQEYMRNISYHQSQKMHQRYILTWVIHKSKLFILRSNIFLRLVAGSQIKWMIHLTLRKQSKQPKLQEFKKEASESESKIMITRRRQCWNMIKAISQNHRRKCYKQWISLNLDLIKTSSIQRLRILLKISTGSTSRKRQGPSPSIKT